MNLKNRNIGRIQIIDLWAGRWLKLAVCQDSNMFIHEKQKP